jgi:catechol 2,3-dioxygenase-like lactoylglutathione lyase family enzyme
VIYVSDLNRSIRFYSELLGFELRVRHGVYWAELAAGTTTLALRLAQPNSAAASTTETKEPTAGSASASFFVKDLNAFHERAVQFDGCKVVKEPARQPWFVIIASERFAGASSFFDARRRGDCVC